MFFAQSCILILLLLSSLLDAQLFQRQQLTFPPSNGPCAQNRGQTPLQCSDPQCLNIPVSGVCNIQGQDGLPICGCCDQNITLACSGCGGDAGGGICEGTGPTDIAYQGCPCSTSEGDIPPGGEDDDDFFKVCPEDRGSATQSCSAAGCAGSPDATEEGICNAPKYLLGSPVGYYRFCSCCPDDTELGCNDCGGDNGAGRCKGIQQYEGIQYLNCSCTPGKGDGGGVFPIPIPPPGWPIPPPGTPEPTQPCSDTVDVKCSDCGGKDSWCQEGPSAGCPCEDDDEIPCPTGVDVPKCSDANCGGATDDAIISTCLGDDEGLNKDCPCFQYYPSFHGDSMFTDVELALQQVLLAQLNANATAPPPSTSTSSQPTATGTRTCSSGTVAVVPAGLVETGGTVTPNQLLYTLREVICNNACDQPAGLPPGIVWASGSKSDGDCELSVAISTGIEAYMYRGTPSTDVQWQQCWDSTDAIIKTCVNNGPNVGWVNGPATYQFYQGGFRPLNDPSAIHAPMSGTGLQSDPAIGAIAPTGRSGLTCGSGTGGTLLANCLDILGSIGDGTGLDATDTTPRFCTDDVSCQQKGDSGSADGKTVYSAYCEVASVSGCSFVLASKASSFGGFPGRSCISPADMSTFIRLGANQCGAGQADGVWAAGFQAGDDIAGVPYTVLAMVDASDPGAVYVP